MHKQLFAPSKLNKKFGFFWSLTLQMNGPIYLTQQFVGHFYLPSSFCPNKLTTAKKEKTILNFDPVIPHCLDIQSYVFLTSCPPPQREFVF